MSALSATARREYYTELGDSLPPPVIRTRENHERRLATAVEVFEALRPGDAYEARLAVKIVLCGAHAADCLRQAGVYREDFAKMTRCRAQAASMMRQESAAKRSLAQEQKVRLATEVVAGGAPAHPVPVSAPPQQAAPHALPPPRQAAAPAPQPTPGPAVAPRRLAAPHPARQPAAAESALPPSPDSIAEAEAFAQENIGAAAQIRHDRGVTPQNQAHFRHVVPPHDPAVIDALVRGISDVLTVLDEIGGEDLDAAA